MIPSAVNSEDGMTADWVDLPRVAHVIRLFHHNNLEGAPFKDAERP